MIGALWNIPKTWIWTEIKDLGEIVSGGTPSTKEPAYWGDEINWISPSDLTGYHSKTIAKGAKNLTLAGLKNSSAKVMPAGSVHFSSRAPIGYVAISSQPICTNQGFKSLVPSDGIFNEYAYYYLKASKYLAEERATGTTFKEISGTAFSKLPFPLPSTNEQKRIVAKIEELFSELDSGIESLKTARAQLKVYRQAVLKHAFEGKLTTAWREKNKIEFKQEKIKFIELCESSQNGLSKRSGNDGVMIPVIRLADITSEEIDLSDLREIRLSEGERTKYQLLPNDLLCIRVNGSPSLVGRLVLIKTDRVYPVSTSETNLNELLR